MPWSRVQDAPSLHHLDETLKTGRRDPFPRALAASKIRETIAGWTDHQIAQLSRAHRDGKLADELDDVLTGPDPRAAVADASPPVREALSELQDRQFGAFVQAWQTEGAFCSGLVKARAARAGGVGDPGPDTTAE